MASNEPSDEEICARAVHTIVGRLLAFSERSGLDLRGDVLADMSQADYDEAMRQHNFIDAHGNGERA